MTLSELKTIQAVLKSVITEDKESDNLVEFTRKVIEREIKLKTINPVTGREYNSKCPECGFTNGHTNYCSQGRD